MNDSRIIRYHGGRFTPENSVSLRYADLAWLDETSPPATMGRRLW